MKNISTDGGALVDSTRPVEASDFQAAPNVLASASALNLPPVNTKRWVTRRKAEVVNAVRSGVISLDEACRRYKLSIEEFASWQALIDHHGLAGLRATRVQDYRGGPKQRG